MSEDDYVHLSLIVRHVSDAWLEDVFKDLSVRESCIEVRELLQQEAFIRYDKKTEVWTKEKRLANRHESKVQKSKREFLNDCLQW